MEEPAIIQHVNTPENLNVRFNHQSVVMAQKIMDLSHRVQCQTYQFMS